MSRWKVALLLVLAAPLVAFGLITALWALFGPDTDAGTPAAVADNVELAGTDIGGLSGAELDRRVTKVTDSFPQTPIKISTPDFTVDTTAGELGLTIDTSATTADALRIGRADQGPAAPLRWAKSLLSPRVAPVRITVDRETATAVITSSEGNRRTEPTEPTLTVTPERVASTSGKSGRALDIDAILDQIPGGIIGIGTPINLKAEQVESKPKLNDDAVAQLAEQANDSTKSPLKLTYGDANAELSGTDLRPGFQLATEGSTPQLTLNKEYIAKLLSEKVSSAPNPTGVTFDIVNGVPTPKPGTDAVVCCGDDAPDQIVKALLSDKTEVALSTKTVTAAQGVEWANSLGVKEVIGEFTTKHPCCAPRVTNIHRMSDLTRGVLIAPGATFSANDFVGKRTKEKGFVSAPVIEDGEFKEDFGGGVSQWATTTFNAAFFGGLDIPVHKAHSIYISRYPFGREATLAFPSVDLKLKNNTPYGVVIWPTYTNGSITVQLWSTRFATGEQTAINKTSGCGYVKVTRTRNFVDGRTANDNFEASYNCNPPKHP